MSMGKELLEKVVGEVCWYVSAGGAAAPSFVLAFGKKVPRATPLTNPMQSEDFRINRGSVELLVWSSWRLQTTTDVLASSDQAEVGLEKLRALNGLRVVSARCVAPAWDLAIGFSDGSELVTFSDHVVPEASIEQNWELWADNRHLLAGPGAVLLEEG